MPRINPKRLAMWLDTQFAPQMEVVDSNSGDVPDTPNVLTVVTQVRSGSLQNDGAIETVPFTLITRSAQYQPEVGEEIVESLYKFINTVSVPAEIEGAWVISMWADPPIPLAFDPSSQRTAFSMAVNVMADAELGDT